MNQKFCDFMENYRGQTLAVAVSGGVDSMCMMDWLAKMGMNIVCLHVNHGLRPTAGDEAAYVASVCKKMKIPCHIFNWTGTKPTHNLEHAARDARYTMMIEFCHKNNIGTICVAHQSDDQIETFLMNLGRGSGLGGLAAMRPVHTRDGIRIIRPMLGVSRAEIKKYCDDNNIKYFMDEMNDDPHYTRVRIRQNRHLLNDKLGISDARILLAIENLGRVRDIIESDVDTMVANVMHDNYALFDASFLFDVGADIRLKFVGTLIQRIGKNVYQPRLNSLKIALEKLQNDCKFTLGHCTIRRLGQRIIIVPEGSKTSFRKRHEKNKKRIQG